MQEDRFRELDNIGSSLSIEICCVVRQHQDSFICRHGAIFPIVRLRENSDWLWVKDAHKKVCNGPRTW